jgi:acetyltransferase-like isoleucine patch superfamily enzyme
MALRALFKASVFAAAVLLVWPFWILSWLERRLGRGEQLFSLGAQLFSLLPGAPGRILRAAYYVGTLEHCHWEVNVGFGSLFVKRAASMGRHASTGCYCVLGNADIGERVMIGSRVSIPSGKRQHFDDAGRLTSGASHFDRVSVGAGSWIGEGAIVMADVGSQCVVAAGSVVGKEVPDRSIVSGNPARVVRAVDVECES